MVSALIVCSCHKAPEPPAQLKAFQDSFSARWTAAFAIRDLTVRQEAFRKFALDAAEVDDVESAMKILVEMHNLEKGNFNLLRDAPVAPQGSTDKASEACALLFAKHGALANAKKAAGWIESQELRDRTLGAIVAGH